MNKSSLHYHGILVIVDNSQAGVVDHKFLYYSENLFIIEPQLSSRERCMKIYPTWHLKYPINMVNFNFRGEMSLTSSFLNCK